MDKLLDLFSFEGRANRAWYFWHILLDDLAIFTGVLIFVMLGVLTGIPLFFLPAVGVALAGGWAGLAITVKRLHDLGRPGWHWWLLLVPIYNFVLGFQLLITRGVEGPNEYGRDPLQAANTDQYLP